MPNTRRTSAKEDYLKAIFALGPEGRRVHTTELALHLGVRKPSVTAMVKRLAEAGWVDYSPRQGVRLTEEGRLATMQVVRRHRLLETFLVEVLGLDWSEVHAEAEVLEHHLSERMVDAIDGVLGHPREDPHGHPIPDAERRQRWKELGLVPGASVRMGERLELEDVMHVEIGGATIVTGSEGVDGVFVERVA
ncbi:MAG: metal-dependent transcriptional regulator [Planctomycetota bacterium]|jgi:DtxR family Mn-dependent transcriptional regulator